MRHRASKIDFRRLAGEVEDSESESEVEQASTAKKSIVTSSKYHLGEEKRDGDDEHPKDACVCCHQVSHGSNSVDDYRVIISNFLHCLTLSQVCTGEAASFVAQCWTNLNADAPGAVRLREALTRHLSVFVPSDDQRLLCPNCQDDLTAVLDRIEGIK